MSDDAYVGAIDQGTTGTRFMVFDREGRVVARAYERHEQRYPNPGWVEHDPIEIWLRTKSVIQRALEETRIDAERLAAIGVANQRETTVLWDVATGDPLHDAIVWQDRRTTERIETLEAGGKVEWIRETTGLQPDAYFSATKAEWLLDHADRGGSGDRGSSIRDRAARGEVLLGTIDSWLCYNLTGEHVTDVTNASRTMLFDIHDLDWDDGLLAEFGVPRASLPEIRPSSDGTGYGHTDPDGFLGADVPVTGAIGDQQAALAGQTCFDPGEVKNTCGTGSFLLLNTGERPISSDNGLVTTIAFGRSGEPVTYALEGSIFATGAAIEWLCDVGLVDNADETERLAKRVDSTDDVYVVPAFAGLGAPHWDGRARGTIVGLTRGTRREHLARAVLESTAYQTRDIVDAMVADSGIEIGELAVDGGVVANDLICQLLADAVGVDVVRPVVEETTALGAAYAAGLAIGYWSDVDDLRANRGIDRTFEPDLDRTVAVRRHARWCAAVERSRGWARE